MGVELVVKQDNWAKIRANLSLAKKSYVAVGWPSEKAKSKAIHDTVSGMTNVQVATANEVGSGPGVKPYIPARPMVAETVKRTTAAVKELQKKALAGISAGEMSAKVALEQIGRYFQGELEISIRMPAGGWKAENTTRTKAQKGSDVPLVNKGKLFGSVSWVVRMRSAHSRHAWDSMTQRRRAIKAAGEGGPA